jgi:hypothetical protein
VPDTLTALALIPVVGVAAAWVAWRLHVPGILALLAAGLVLGPWLGWLDPDELFGDLLAPLVSLAVGLILFEGGLSLTRAELREGGAVVSLLLTVGVGVTFLVAVVLGMTVLGLPGDVASVTAAVLVVTGPTVVGPLLAAIRPHARIAAVRSARGSSSTLSARCSPPSCTRSPSSRTTARGSSRSSAAWPGSRSRAPLSAWPARSSQPSSSAATSSRTP